MKVISCFAGMGGSSLGYKQAGCEVVAMIEWDKHACQVYRLNHPNTIVYQGDIEKISCNQILEDTNLKVGELDILDGSPPCQGFSVCGKRILDDPRNSLFKAFLRIADELKPKNIVIENVAGMIRGKMKKAASEIIRSLKERGYFVTAGLIKAIHFGVPQLRPRVFFLASKTSKPRLPDPTSKIITAGEALKGVVDISGIEAKKDIKPSLKLFLNLGRNGETQVAFNKRIGLKGGYNSYWIGSTKIPSRTITKEYSTLLHWDRRYFNITEALVLTGFPPDYKMIGSYSQCWQRIGNSVAPPMARAIAKSIMEQNNG